MSNGPYVNELTQIAQQEIPSLQHDVENATTPMALRDVCIRLLNIVGYLVHNTVLSVVQPQTGAGTTARTPPPRPAAPRPPARTSLPLTTPVVPTAPPRSAPQVAPLPMARAVPDLLPPPPALAGQAPPAGVQGIPDAPHQPGVANVTITPQGTHVITASGNRSVLPPGVAVPAEATSDDPPVPPEAPEGVENVVLPPGGGMSPDVAEALARRSTDEPSE